MPLENTSTS